MPKKRVRINRAIVHPIVAEGAMVNGSVAGGRLVPRLIIDVSQRPDVLELIRLHQHVNSGDCEFRWARIEGDIALSIDFLRPIVTSVVILFDLPRLGIVVDLILHARAIYLQHGVDGERVGSTLDRESILIQVSSVGFETEWEKIYLRRTVREIQKSGLSRAEAKRQAVTLIASLRRFNQFGMAPPSSLGVLNS